jgi:hypothetical protein
VGDPDVMINWFPVIVVLPICFLLELLVRESFRDALSPAKGNRPPPIYITLQDPKDTVALIQDILKIRNFHIKRIHADKHVLYLQNLNDYNKAKEILITTDTAFYTYTSKSQKTTHIIAKRTRQ